MLDLIVFLPIHVKVGFAILIFVVMMAIYDMTTPAGVGMDGKKCYCERCRAARGEE